LLAVAHPRILDFRSPAEHRIEPDQRTPDAGAGVALIAAGVIIVVWYIAEPANTGDLKGTSSDLVRRWASLPVARLAIAGAGILVIVAAILTEPNKATGVDGALKTLGAQPYGAALLIAAGLGIITYGLYSFAMARYTKM
jgi:hypothetical protein